MAGRELEDALNYLNLPDGALRHDRALASATIIGDELSDFLNMVLKREEVHWTPGSSSNVEVRFTRIDIETIFSKLNVRRSTKAHLIAGNALSRIMPNLGWSRTTRSVPWIDSSGLPIFFKEFKATLFASINSKTHYCRDGSTRVDIIRGYVHREIDDLV